MLVERMVKGVGGVEGDGCVGDVLPTWNGI